MILVTGATGFVGKAVVQRLLTEDESQCVAVAGLNSLHRLCACLIFV